MKKDETKLYVAYGSNMSLEQMEFRCPNAVVKESVKIYGYRLAFRGKSPGNGVATIIPEPGGKVNAVVWKITPECEMSLDRYEGYPHLYGKEQIMVHSSRGRIYPAEVYVMQEPYRKYPALPSGIYLEGILVGADENNIPTERIMEAVKRTSREVLSGKRKKHNRVPDQMR